MNPKPLSECAVVILGGTAGVGLETAIHFARQGSQDRAAGPQRGTRPDRLDNVRERVPGAAVEYVQVDATNPASAVEGARVAQEGLGGIDVRERTTGPSHPRNCWNGFRSRLSNNVSTNLSYRRCT